MKVDGIIFDLDGTLWDSCRSVAESWQQTLRRWYDPERIVTLEQIHSIMGMTPSQIADRLLPDLGDRAMEACHRCLVEECGYIAVHGASIYPGTGEVLEALAKHCPLYIVSNCIEGYIECFLEYSGFGRYFSGFLNQGVTGLEKSGNIRLIIDRNSLEHPVYVGDTAQDQSSAAEAGCPFVHAAYGFGSAPGAELRIESITELESVLELSRE